MKPNYEHFAQILDTVYDTGVYLSTKVNEATVITTYYVDGFFVDLAFNTSEGKITDVFVDDTFCLNTNCITRFNNYLLNHN
jgi:hypothetical protein